MKTFVFYVYILTNTYNTVLYTGFTNDLERRCSEHRNKVLQGFTSRYNISKLVYYEVFDNAGPAISREKQIKKYSRSKKDALITQFNPRWVDLFFNNRIHKP